MADLSRIASIQGIQPTELPRLGAQPQEKTAGAGFGDTLNGLINNVDSIQKNAHETTRRMLTGEIEDVHQVMIAAEEASTSFQLMMEVRNKIVDAYREVMRMQV